MLWDNVIMSVKEDTAPVSKWDIALPYPHPAMFPMELRLKTATYSSVRIEVYDVLGRRVRTLLNTQRPGGEHVVRWDGYNDITGAFVASGLYVVHMRAQAGRQTYVSSRTILAVR